MGLAAYGKHPAKGDFLAYGVPSALQAPLEGWLDAVLAEARGALGAAWETVWRDAPLLRFWIGEGIWGLPVAGVMAPSEDRVGRRFPLILFCAGDAAARLPAPTVGADRGWYDAMALLLRDRLAQRDLGGPGDLLTGGAEPAGDAALPAPGPDAFWAVRPGPDVAGLLADVALTDHRRAAAGRSYWWVAGEAPPDPPPMPLHVPTPDALPERAAGDAPVTEAPMELAALWQGGPPDLPEDDGSPFAGGATLGLFAPPEPADAAPAADPRAAPAPPPAGPMAPAPALPRLRCSAVWAGTGLPSGTVLAWFLRGVEDM